MQVYLLSTHSNPVINPYCRKLIGTFLKFPRFKPALNNGGLGGGGGRCKKFFFRPFRPLFGLKIGSPLDPPLPLYKLPVVSKTTQLLMEGLVSFCSPKPTPFHNRSHQFCH